LTVEDIRKKSKEAKDGRRKELTKTKHDFTRNLIELSDEEKFDELKKMLLKILKIVHLVFTLSL
jgi:hypothetical protein